MVTTGYQASDGLPTTSRESAAKWANFALDIAIGDWFTCAITGAQPLVTAGFRGSVEGAVEHRDCPTRNGDPIAGQLDADQPRPRRHLQPHQRRPRESIGPVRRKNGMRAAGD